MRYYTFVLFVLLSSSIFAQNQKIVFETNLSGEVVSGSLDTLIQLINQGHTVRIGWGMDFDKDGIPNVEHWTDAEFITIMGGHVFNQVQDIYYQQPLEKIPQINIQPSDMQWMAIIGTNSKMIHRFIVPGIRDTQDEKLIEQIIRMNAVQESVVSTKWAVVF